MRRRVPITLALAMGVVGSTGLLLLPQTAAPGGRAAQLSFAIRAPGDDTTHLYLSTPDGSRLQKLENIRGDKQDPDWSPDGSQVVFRWLARGDYSYTPILRMDADGSDVLNLSKVSGVAGWSPSWSPDGKRLVAAAAPPGRKLALYVMNSDGTRLRRIFAPRREAQYPAWSPNGRTIAFTQVTPEGGFDIYTVRPDGSRPTRLTNDGRSNWAMWSPDSRLIAWGKEGPRGGEIWVMNQYGAKKRLVTRRWNPGVPGAWEPGKLVFQCIRPGTNVVGICSVDPDGKNFESLLGGREAGFPSWRQAR